jgi:tetratricopeptide (TPR) repeat protein
VRTLFVLLLLCGVARAQDAEQKARQLYKKAQSEFEAARYQEALEGYQGAHRLTPYPAILHRIALCHDLLGHRELAISYYERYLVEDPETSRRPAVQARLGELRKPIATAPPPPELRAPPPPLPEPPRRASGRPLWIAGAIVGVAGLALIGGGAGMSAQSADATSQLDALFAGGGTFDETAQAHDRRRSDALSASIALYTVGGAALVTGVALVAVGIRRDRVPRVSLAPIPGGALIGWRCAF